MTTAVPVRRLPLKEDALYDIETTAGVVWHRVRWHQANYAFMLNAKGGIPMGFVQRVSRAFADEWFALGEVYVPRTPWER